MTRRILVVLGHPDPAPERLCRSLAAAYREGAEAAGHEVRFIDLATTEVPILRSQHEFMKGEVPGSLRPASEAVRWAEHVVIVFPLWLGTMPALLKAFLEQVMRPGVAFAYANSGNSGFPKAALKGRTGRLVVTMGMPAIVYRLWFRRHGIASLHRNILNFVGIRPVRETLFGMVEAGDDAKQADWIEAMRAMGRRGD